MYIFAEKFGGTIIGVIGGLLILNAIGYFLGRYCNLISIENCAISKTHPRQCLTICLQQSVRPTGHDFD